MATLAEKLESITVERDRLVSEEAARGRTSTEEREQLLSRVASLSEERDELQERLDGRRQELEDRMEMVQLDMLVYSHQHPS